MPVVNHHDVPTPTRLQKWTAAGGMVSLFLLVPVVVSVFGRSAIRWLLAGGGLLVILWMAVVIVRRHRAKRFPIIVFGIGDVSAPAEQVEDAKARLAGGDYAAFVVAAVRDQSDEEAQGQIWVHADRTGDIKKTDLVVYFAWAGQPAAEPILARLFEDGWELTRWEPDHWAMFTYPAGIQSAEAISVLVGVMSALFDLPVSTQWSFRAFA